MTFFKTTLSFSILLLSRGLSRLFYTTRTRWIGDPPADPWSDVRIIALLHHTSLYEWLYITAPPLGFVYRIAAKAVIPVADVTTDRPLVGAFFKALTSNVVPVTRKNDGTWQRVMDSLGSDKMLVILPEGRMMRPNGLDKEGRPMNVRGGIADIISNLSSGRLLLAYSGGLHHIQAPGQSFPRLFKTLHLSLESLDLEEYRRGIGGEPGSAAFKQAVKQDLDRRRDQHARPF